MTVRGLGQAWAGVAGAPVRSEPRVANGVLCRGASSGVLVTRDAATGAVLRTAFQTPGRRSNVMTSVVVANGAVYAARHGTTSHG